MTTTRLILLLLLTVGSASTAMAQLTFPGYLPSQCEGAASRAIDGANDGVVVAVMGIGAEVPIGGATLSIGLNMDDGKSPIWIYIVHSPSLDTLAVVPLFRLLGCNDPGLTDQGGILDALEGLQLTGLPADFIEGSALTSNIKDNGDYKAWAAVHPDSTPSATVLATTDEEFLGFPAGTPFWAINWFPGEAGGIPFVCLVHASTGQTVCLGEDVVSVDDQGENGLFALAPNPATSDVVITLPNDWTGRQVTVDAVDISGRSVRLLASSTISMPQLFLSTAGLTPGVWSIRVSDGQHLSTMLLTVAH